MKKKKKLRKVLAIVSVVIIICIVYVALCFARDDNVIWDSARVNGVLIEGMTKPQAEEAVNRAFAETCAGSSLTLRVDDASFDVPMEGVLAVDAASAVEEAWSAGHGYWFTRGAEWIISMVKRAAGQELSAAAYISDEEGLKERIRESGVLDYDTLTETTWEVDGDSLLVHKGRGGIEVDEESLYDVVEAAVNAGNLDGEVICPVTAIPAETPDFKEAAREVYSKASDAYMNKDHKIVEGSRGVKLDTDEAVKLFEKAEDGTDYLCPLEIEEPEMSTEKLQDLLFRDKLSGYTTVYYSIWGRNDNLKVATSFINGTILLPGETFSYNDTLGDITVDKGYQYGDAYSGGDVVTVLGGGVCQVASTIYATTLFTNLEIVERRNHSLLIGYLPLGYDATVYSPVQDFKFKNNRDYPIRIDAAAKNGTVYVQIYGTKIEGEPEVNAYTVGTGALRVETYREYLDKNGEVLETEDMGPSQYSVHKARTDD